MFAMECILDWLVAAEEMKNVFNSMGNETRIREKKKARWRDTFTRLVSVTTTRKEIAIQKNIALEKMQKVKKAKMKKKIEFPYNELTSIDKT